MTTRLVQAIMLAVQSCLIVLALVLVFWPSIRTETAMNFGVVLSLATVAIVLWRMSRTGATGLSMAALWARMLRDPSGTSSGVGYLDILAIGLSGVVLFLAR